MNRHNLNEEESKVVGVPAAARILGVSQQTLRSALVRGDLLSFKLGGQRKIPKAAIARLMGVE